MSDENCPVVKVDSLQPRNLKGIELETPGNQNGNYKQEEEAEGFSVHDYNTTKTLKLILSNSNSEDIEPNIYNFSPVSKNQFFRLNLNAHHHTLSQQRSSGEFNLTFKGQSTVGDGNKYQSLQTCFKNTLEEEQHDEVNLRRGSSPYLADADHEEYQQQYSFGQSFQPTPKNNQISLEQQLAAGESYQAAVNDTDFVDNSIQEQMTFDFSGTTLFKLHNEKSHDSTLSAEKETRIRPFEEKVQDQNQGDTEAMPEDL